jgi:hypothetical protein
MSQCYSLVEMSLKVKPRIFEQLSFNEITTRGVSNGRKSVSNRTHAGEFSAA